jgi:hypothetical protein
LDAFLSKVFVPDAAASNDPQRPILAVRTGPLPSHFKCVPSRTHCQDTKNQRKARDLKESGRDKERNENDNPD